MHGAGNDYIYLNGFEAIPEDLSKLAVEVSDRHFGVGSDGLVVICPSDVADFRMRMYNSDGSEAEMCGNASRCIGKYVYDRGLTDKTEVTLETLAGIKVLKLHVENGEVTEVTVDMGEPELRPDRVPVVSTSADRMINERITVNNTEYDITAVSMGNPHAVVFVNEITDEQVLGRGPELERAEVFPRKANIEFARVVARHGRDLGLRHRCVRHGCGRGAERSYRPRGGHSAARRYAAHPMGRSHQPRDDDRPRTVRVRRKFL